MKKWAPLQQHLALAEASRVSSSSPPQCWPSAWRGAFLSRWFSSSGRWYTSFHMLLSICKLPPVTCPLEGCLPLWKIEVFLISVNFKRPLYILDSVPPLSIWLSKTSACAQLVQNKVFSCVETGVSSAPLFCLIQHVLVSFLRGISLRSGCGGGVLNFIYLWWASFLFFSEIYSPFWIQFCRRHESHFIT